MARLLGLRVHIKRTFVHGELAEDTKTTSSKAPVPVIGIVKKYLDAHLARNSGTGYIFHAPRNPAQPIVAGRHYIKPSLELMRSALEKVETRYVAIERDSLRNRPR
jgi:hypothetical protein